VLRRYATSIVLLLLAAGGGYAWRVVAQRGPRQRVPVTDVAKGEFVVSLLAEGPLESDDLVVVRTGKAAGELTMIVPEGTVLKEGDVFCELEARELLRRKADQELSYKQALEGIEESRDRAEERVESDQRALLQARQDLEAWEESTSVRTKQAEDQLAYDRAEADRLRLDYERTKRLADKGYQAGTEAEIAKAGYDAQLFRVEQSVKELELNRQQIASERRQRQSGVAARERRVQISRDRIEGRVARSQRWADVAAERLRNTTSALADAVIQATASGTVALFSTFEGGERRAWREGDHVASGTPLGTISGSENMSVRCRIKENKIGLVRRGLEAAIQFESLPGMQFSGVVSSVGTVAREVWVWEDPTAEANERVFDVIVKVEQPEQGVLKPGLNAQVVIAAKRLPGVLYVPLDAVFKSGDNSLVYVKRGGGFSPREVETGDANDVAVVILDGLSEGDEVALADPTRKSR
jgi:HlyD family secretion protein